MGVLCVCVCHFQHCEYKCIICDCVLSLRCWFQADARCGHDADPIRAN